MSIHGILALRRLAAEATGNAEEEMGEQQADRRQRTVEVRLVRTSERAEEEDRAPDDDRDEDRVLLEAILK